MTSKTSIIFWSWMGDIELEELISMVNEHAVKNDWHVVSYQMTALTVLAVEYGELQYPNNWEHA